MSSSLTIAAQSLVVLCVVVLALSLLHKLRVSSTGLADEHFALTQAAHIPPRFAGVAIVTAGVVEIAIVVGFMFATPIALGAFAVLLLGYAAALARMAGDTSCACFGDTLDVPRKVAVGRNVVLAGFVGATAIVGLGQDLTSNLLSEAVIGWSLVVLAVWFGATRSLRIVSESSSPASGGSG